MTGVKFTLIVYRWPVVMLVALVLTSVGERAFGQRREAYISKVWVPDKGDGSYKNPVLFADYSDPDAIRVGDHYYLVSSSFNCAPGLPVLCSKDMVNWRLIGHALRRLPPDNLFDKPLHGKGVWAPAIRYHKGEFYIYYGDPDQGIYMVKAKDPSGPWQEPVLVLKGNGIIDPCPLWDEEGNAWLVVAWAGSRAGINSMLTVFRMTADGTKVTGEGKHVFDGHDRHHTVEGPKFYKKGDWYYIFAPAGGVETGWQLVLRSKDIYGPYEEKVVLEQGNTPVNGPHQGALLDTGTGESWFLHFQDKGAYGRVVHLQPVVWKNDWPVIGEDKDGDGKGEPVLTFKKPGTKPSSLVETPAENDEFDSDTLGLQWQWQANPMIQWSALIRGSNQLRLFAFPEPQAARNLWDVPNLLLQKFPAPGFTATTKVEFHIEWDVWSGKRAGLLVMGSDYACLTISKDSKGYLLRQIICRDAQGGAAEEIVGEQRLSGPAVFLKVDVTSPDALCRFSYSEDGVRFIPVGKTFRAVPGRWMGAKVGLFCSGPPGVRIGGYADFDWFRVSSKE